MPAPRIFTVNLSDLKRDMADPAFRALLEKGWTLGFASETLEQRDEPGVPKKLLVMFPPASASGPTRATWGALTLVAGLALGISGTLLGLGISCLILAGIALGVAY